METKAPGVPKRPHDSPWWLFLLVAAVIIAPLYCLAYSTLYTEGEVMQGLFHILLCVVVLSGGLAFFRRTLGIAVIAGLGGLLLCWQASEVRKWTMIHEDVTAFVRYANEVREDRGTYPSSVDAYPFKHPGTRPHIHSYVLGTNGEYTLTYFMDNPGISYWYSSSTGFGYYPD